MPIKDDGRSIDSTGAVSVDYDAACWEPIANEPLPCDVAEFRNIMEGSSPGFYKLLAARHRKVRAIYAHCRQRELQARKAVLSARGVGRNDRCPCGSGKKYKKCCMVEAEIARSGRTDEVRTSTVRSVTRLLGSR
jgi:hypothetical protein